MTVDTINIMTNAICNFAIFIAMLLFIIFVFGRRNSLVYQYGDFQAIFLKFGLTFSAVGSLWSALTLSTPQFSEILMNIGFAVLFIWAAVFHYFVFIKKVKPKYNKNFKEENIGSTWIISLIAQIINTILIILLLSVTSETPFDNLLSFSLTAVFFTFVQLWSFYSIFKTLKIRMTQKSVIKQRKKK
jgi:hypothetical protein